MRRNLAIVIVAALLMVVAGLAIVDYHAVPPRQAPPPEMRPPEAANPAAAATAPSFDAVHVGPDGMTVLAGRAAPNAEVTVLNHGQPIGHVTADANGEWVLMPDKPLPPGPQELSLAARTQGEPQPVESGASVAVLVPERQPASPPQPPVAVLLPNASGGAARPLQVPGARAPHHVALDIVEYDAAGRTILSGRADSGATIDIYVDDRRLGAATADVVGNWQATLAGGVPAGHYRLRLVAHDAQRGEADELALDLRRASPQELASGSAIDIIPGNTLWHLAQRSYGDGLRYVEIYRANRDKVEDPDRIFPNQLLSIPAKP